MTARRLADSFSAYLMACKHDERALSTLPPGRFSCPATWRVRRLLTFAPCPISAKDTPAGLAARR